MNLNATLLGEIITFALLVIFTMRFVWPPLSKMLDERAVKIADGLAAAEKGREELLSAETKIAEEMKKIQLRAHEIIANAEKRSNQMIEEAKGRAQTESQQIIKTAHAQIEQDLVKIKEDLRLQVGNLVMCGVKQVLQNEVNLSIHEKMIAELKAEL